MWASRRLNNLVKSYGLDKHMTLLMPAKATEEQMVVFHYPKYIQFLRKIVPDEVDLYATEMTSFGLSQDPPVFDGVNDFASTSTGVSLACAAQLNSGNSEIFINWMESLQYA